MATEDAGSRALAAASQLEKIGFVEFTTHLVRDVYQVIVKASMDQLNAYADFVAKIARGLEGMEAEVLGSTDEEKDKKIETYITGPLGFQLPDDADDDYQIEMDEDNYNGMLEEFSGITIDVSGEKKTFKDIVTDSAPWKVTLGNLKKFVEAKLKGNAKSLYETLVTVLKIGMQKVVVTNGEIYTKLTFHVDASDVGSKDSTRRSQKASGWGVNGSLRGGVGGGGIISKFIVGATLGGSFGGGYSSRKLSVSVVNEKSSTATNVNVDIIGGVKINFRTETFPAVA
jgi:hypothetical protein